MTRPDTNPAPTVGRVGVIGGGSWATALAKIALQNCDRIGWYMRRADRIAEFRTLGHNPAYLSDVLFDTARIDFTDRLDELVRTSDTLIVAVPSPFFKFHLERLAEPLAGKLVVSAIKGIVPGENRTVTDYLAERYGVPRECLVAVSGPCHAEEVALERLSYLTAAGYDPQAVRTVAQLLACRFIRVRESDDVRGVEYTAVLKNVYALCAGICDGLKCGDNFQAVLLSNAAREMRRFLDTACPASRDVCDSVYLGDLLVTGYSRFSRNRAFGTLIGKGYSVKATAITMEMVAEGYYGTACIEAINRTMGIDMPIHRAVYRILYENARPELEIRRLSESLD